LTPIFDDSQPLDSKKINNKIILGALNSIGISAEVSGRNDLTFNGKKVKKMIDK